MEIKTMEQNPETEKYAKAKIEQPVQEWPEFIRKPGGILGHEHRFLKIFEFDPLKTEHVMEAIEAGEQTDRKLYRLRSDDVFELVKENCKCVEHISRVSKATIALFSDDASLYHGHSYVDLMGTVDQVKTAEKLIIDNILKRYHRLVFPVILMAPSIQVQSITMPLYKVERLMGPNGSSIVILEMESGVWLSIQNGPDGGVESDRVVTIYGPPKHIIKALSLIQYGIHKPSESSELHMEIEDLIKELQYNLEKEMYQLHFEIDVYESVKTEAPNLHLPDTLNTDPTSGDTYYKYIFEDKNLNEAVAAGAQAVRKVYRVRDKNLVKAFGENFEELKSIQRVSKSTIRLFTNPESTLVGQSFIEFIGTVDQVKTAEHIILDKILQTYFCVFYPIIFMPPTVSHHKRKLPLNKIELLMEDKLSHVSSIEALSGTWIEIDKGGSQSERLVHIYCPMSHMAEALSLINSEIYEPGETIDTEDELEEMFSELHL